MAPRLLLIPEFTEPAWETVRPDLSAWGEVASFDAPSIRPGFAAALRDFCERVLAGDAALGVGRLER
jgi:hypothetical protein